MSTRSKGNRTKAKIVDYYKEQGYFVIDGESVSKYAKVQDIVSDYCLTCKSQCWDHKGKGLLCKCGDEDSKQNRFPGFDLLVTDFNRYLFVQCKTNSPATQAPYKQFAKRFAGRNTYIVVATWYDRIGLRIQRYCKNGSIIEKDLRK